MAPTTAPAAQDANPPTTISVEIPKVSASTTHSTHRGSDNARYRAQADDPAPSAFVRRTVTNSPQRQESSPQPQPSRTSAPGSPDSSTPPVDTVTMTVSLLHHDFMDSHRTRRTGLGGTRRRARP